LNTVSVVTISYNQAPYLRATIESVLSQKGVNVEYIICDAGSTDGSRDIILEYAARLAAVVFENDAGPADGLNKGLARCTAPFFYYLNSDDLVAPDAFREATDILADDPNMDAVFGNGWFIDAQGTAVDKVYSAQHYSAAFGVMGLGAVLQQATFFRTDSVKRVGGFNPKNKVNWDGELLFTLANGGARMKRVWRDWGYFRVYPASISGSGAYVDKIAIEQARMRDRLAADGRNSFWLWMPRRVVWLGMRVMDWRRWPSYLRGSKRPHTVAARGGSEA